jgi:hypothetical protein
MMICCFNKDDDEIYRYIYHGIATKLKLCSSSEISSSSSCVLIVCIVPIHTTFYNGISNSFQTVFFSLSTTCIIFNKTLSSLFIQ